MLVIISIPSLDSTQVRDTGLHGDGEGEQDDLGLSHSEHLAQSSEVVVLCRPYC